jgi:hypothetical protein
VKTLLSASDADHSDACGYHLLLVGVVMVVTVPPLDAKGNLRSALSDWVVAQRCCFLAWR